MIENTNIMPVTDEWDLVIKSKSSLFDLKLKQVWHYRDLLFLFVRRDFVAFYKQTILGPLWFFVQPIFTIAMYSFIFGGLAGISTDGLPQPLFYLVGITAWSYFSDCLLKTSTVFKDSSGIFGKVYFPRLIMPLSIVASSMVRLFVQFILLLVAMMYYYVTGAIFEPTVFLLVLPVLILLMALQGLGLGMIISALTTKYRDLALLLTFGVQLLMYATTVVYPLSSLTGKMRTVVALNPMTSIIEGMRLGLLGKGTFDWDNLAYVTATTLVIVVLGTIIFNKVERNFVDTI